MVSRPRSRTWGIALLTAAFAVGAPLLLMLAQGDLAAGMAVIERSATLLVRDGTPYLPAHQLSSWLAYDPYLPAMALFGLPSAAGLQGAPGDPRVWLVLVTVAALAAGLRVLLPHSVRRCAQLPARPAADHGVRGRLPGAGAEPGGDHDRPARPGPDAAGAEPHQLPGTRGARRGRARSRLCDEADRVARDPGARGDGAQQGRHPAGGRVHRHGARVCHHGHAARGDRQPGRDGAEHRAVPARPGPPSHPGGILDAR